ncbi:119_t:CDS:2, partial [Funneliformis caledonium]
NSDREEQKKLAEDLLKDLYIQLKQDLAFPEEIQEILPTLNEEDDDIFAKMWSSDQRSTLIENNEISGVHPPIDPKDIKPLSEEPDSYQQVDP